MAAAVLLLLVIPATAIVVDARGGAAGRGVPLATGGLSTIEGPVGAITLLARSLAWAVAVAAGAAIAGSFAARGLAFAWFGAARGRSIAPAVATVALGSLTLLPPSLLVYSLWSATGPGTALGEWTGLGEDAVRGRHLSLALGLLLWATPAATIVVAAWRAAHPDRGIELRRLDGVRGAAEALARTRHALPGAFLAMLAVGLGIFGETVGFDLAQVRTYGYELRALDALGAAPGELVRLAWPAAVVAVVCGFAALRVARPGPERGRASADAQPSPFTRIAFALTIAIPAAAVVFLLVRIAGLASIGSFVTLHGGSALASLATSAAAGAVVGVLALATRSLGRSGRTGRLVSRVVTVLFLAAAALPATLVALAHEAAWNRALTGPLVYDTATVVVLGLATRFAAVGCVAGLIAAELEPARRRDLVALDGRLSPLDAILRDRPWLLATGLGAAGITLALAFAEIPVSTRLAPPGVELLATSVLNAMHYRQPDTVTAAAWLSVGLGAGVTLAAVVFVRRGVFRPGGSTTASLLLLAALLPLGCGKPDGLPAIPVAREIAGSGYGPGQFLAPRAAAFAPDGRLFVIDKQARVQRFSPEGSYELEWPMPESERGRPVGVSVHPDGRVFVADTHYHRVMVFDRDGTELARFGSYGTGPGEFYYPTDIAFLADGRIAVSEYGGNDRVQVFTDDFRPLSAFGRFGRGNAEFARPQSITLVGDELVVADGCNHRLQVWGLDGSWRRDLGGAGREPGRFAYPYGVESLGDGTVLVAEFGNHRLQRISLADGRPLGAWGGPAASRDPASAAGPEPGRLLYPFAVASGLGFGDGRVAVCDTGHDRVALVPVADLAAPGGDP
jgi:DNA-binding beta-propeller fold protein YncE